MWGRGEVLPELGVGEDEGEEIGGGHGIWWRLRLGRREVERHKGVCVTLHEMGTNKQADQRQSEIMVCC